MTYVVETAARHTMDTPEFLIILTAAVAATVMVVLTTYRTGGHS